ncbi:S41 family peptidase [Seonamhaeicola aphaedonensis]|uniref:C-terminal processing protease CtpA/Prc n=1 Tax=Seonamhaeicola aphaedonensis TaxID=1461338 RepID=A0A3D9H8W0_9FLAO|nr:S41 family peptidase [Seonamhaeicola aphaedonensis]RED45925.1 C-terminal processing protease CtpA/Prc [Seonamhaeicola aphaedonensis]
MKKFKYLILYLTTFCLTGCFTDNDDNIVQASEINDFIYKGMSIFYLYKDNVEVLSNDRFSSDAEYADYLNGFSDPFDLFESLIYDRQNVDRFSWLVDDYFELERQFQGITGTNGMEFTLFPEPNTTNGVFGVVRLVLPNSDADLQGIKRGDIFYAINGEELFFDAASGNNNFNLFDSQSYTINLGTYDDKGTPDDSDDTVESLNQNVLLTKSDYTENPIYETGIFDVGGEKVGYLMFNGFTPGYDDELNEVFGSFKSNNVQHLVLDLRYNPGGRVSIETSLASMITGQFTGQLFTRLIRNSILENTDYNFENKISDGSTINSLGLNKVYVLTTQRSASASEGLINGLNPYIDVIQIGTTTTGKTQASITLYDSPDFSREGVNPNHTYAMQPLIADGVNKDGIKVPNTGLIPDIEFRENGLNYGVIGDENEPFLAVALAEIANGITKFDFTKFESLPRLKQPIKDSNDFITHKGGMIMD